MSQKAWVTTIIDNSDQLIISSRSKIPMGNRILLTGFFIFVAILFLVGAISMPTNSGRVIFLIAATVPAVLGLGVGFWFSKNINKGTGSSTKLILEKKTKVLSTDVENFSINIDEIKGITIGEDAVLLAKIPRLRLKLKDGEKTLLLNFESYEKAQEAKTALEKYL